MKDGGIVSCQVVQEFINVVESKLKQKKLQANLPCFLAQCLYPYTEDLHVGRFDRDLKIINPFC